MNQIDKLKNEHIHWNDMIEVSMCGNKTGIWKYAYSQVMIEIICAKIMKTSANLHQKILSKVRLSFLRETLNIKQQRCQKGSL